MPCTHLDARRDSLNRLLQIKSITGLLKDSKIPILIAGDFKAVSESEVIDILDEHFTRTCEPCDFTIPVDNQDEQLTSLHTPRQKTST